jgi:hypothetical protein
MEENLSVLSIEQLEKLLAQKKREEVERIKAEREAYENYVNAETSNIVKDALRVHDMLKSFHEGTSTKLSSMREKLNEYGMISSNSKGGYHRVTPDGNYKVVYKYTTICNWDERAEKAEDLLRDFLGDTVKKRDAKLHRVISSILEKNAEGRLEYSRIQSLYALENEFDDPRWKEAIRLFKESYYAAGSKMRIEVYQRTEISGKWELITLNLSQF